MLLYILRLVVNPYEVLRLNWNGHQVVSKPMDWSHCIIMFIITYPKYNTVTIFLWI